MMFTSREVGMAEATVIKATFRARGYSAADVDALRDALSPLGAVRTRALALPEAGGAAELWLIVEFIGEAALQGVIHHLAAQFFERFAGAVRGFVRQKAARSEVA